MSKKLTKEEAEEFYNKLWLENKELIQENIDKTNTERFELELELVDKNKEIERLQKENEILRHRLEVANEFIDSRKENMIIDNYDDLKYIINECDLESTW